MPELPQKKVGVVACSAEELAEGTVTRLAALKVLETMRDPAQSTFAFVMYPEATPILEAWRAAKELGTVGIQPGLVVANQVIPAQQANTPFTRARYMMQAKYLGEIAGRFGLPVAQIPLLPQEIKGLAMLAELAEQIYESAGMQD